MLVGIPREAQRSEKRVAATPDTVKRLMKLGFDVAVEAGAGEYASYTDTAFEGAGARIVARDAVWTDSDIVLKVDPPNGREIKTMRDGLTIVCTYGSDEHDPLLAKLEKKKATLVAIDAAPRTTLAQRLDVRSSMANIAGYRAVVEAAHHLGRFIGSQSTAAGSTPPATVLVIGAGVAGLAAIATARGLGAQVRAFDTRSACREQVESLGATFLEVELEEDGEGKGGYAKVMSQAFIDAEMALFREQAKQVDIVITTALIPNRPAPKLWLADMVETMRDGGVVVDLASANGGNCELTEPGKAVVKHGITILGYDDLVSRLPGHASQFYARNLVNLLHEAGGAEAFALDPDNDILRCVTVMEAGEVRWPQQHPEPSPLPKAKPAPAPAPAAPAPKAKKSKGHGHGHAAAPSAPSAASIGGGFLAALVLFLLLRGAPAEFLQHLTVFVVACIVGWQVVWNVTPALHTPLMSVTNAVSGIILVGGLLAAGSASPLASTLGLLAIFVASINIVGGFAVTHRMLQMFKREAN
ncbi:MAG: Re/Si-specific NAD(P)(+) transhydrogenase subunit alpha [Myxococcota bacterium]